MKTNALELSFPHDQWDNLLKDTFEEIAHLAKLKGGEYSGDYDRLMNFRRNAAALDLDYRQVWAVYAGKHWDAIIQYIRDSAGDVRRTRLETIPGRIDDLIVYLLLFKAMVIEQAEPTGLADLNPTPPELS